MAALDFGRIRSLPVVGPTVAKVLDGVFGSEGVAAANRALVAGATKNVDTLLFDVGAPAAAGSTIADATAMTAESNFVTAADASKGVKLPVAVAGRRVFVKNAANAVLKVYPAAAGSTINALSDGAAISMAANTAAWFMADTATHWVTCPLLPS